MTVTQDTSQPLDDSDRYRPADSVLHAERAAAGAALYSAKNTDALAERLTPADFFDPELAVVFQACIELSGSGTAVDIITAYQHLTTTGQLSMLRRSGPTLLANLLADAPPPHPASLAYHAQIVADDAYRRNLRTALASATQYASSHEFERADADTVVERVMQAANGARATGDHEPLWNGDDFADALEELETGAAPTIPTPWSDLNAGVSLETGQLVVAAARPGGGKSVFGLNAAAHLALRHGEGALVASLEMSRRQLQRRLIAAEAKINLSRLEQRDLGPDDWTRIAAVTARLGDAPLVLDAAPGLTIPRLRSRIRHMRSKVTTRLVVVDYLQLMRGPGRYERRDLEIADLTRSLKLLAIDMDVCVIALSQLNRGPEQRTDKRPVMSDLRESGAIENDADTVILLHRPDVDEGPRTGEYDMAVAKQRSGPSGFTVTAAFQGHYARIVDMATAR